MFPCYGWRQVHTGGYVRWYSRKYYHAELAQWAGMWVWIEISDYLAIELNVFVNGQPESSRDEYVVAETRNRCRVCGRDDCPRNHGP